MPLIRVTIWICDGCGRTVSEAETISMYSDPVIGQPEGEEWEIIDGPATQSLIICPTCKAKPHDDVPIRRGGGRR